MIAVIFEVWPKAEAKDEYLRIAAELREYLETQDGFISIERYDSLSEPGKMLSLSFWRDEASIAKWRNLAGHRDAQATGRAELLNGYRIRVAAVTRDYSDSDRAQVPSDSIAANGA